MKNYKNSIWHGIFYMGLGTVLSQLINILIQPILTRIISPEILGVYTYIISLSTMVIPVASLKLDMLVVSEKDDDKAQYITDFCIEIIFIISTLSGVILCMLYFLKIEAFCKYGLIIFIVPFIICTNGLRFLFISYLNRYKQYKIISQVSILREFFRSLIQVISPFLGLGVFGQCLGYTVSPLFGLKIQIKDYLKKKKKREKKTFKEKWNLLGETGRYQVLYLVPGQFINSFSASLITISITVLYSAEDLGFYSAGERILAVPIIFITANISKVVYQKVSECIIEHKYILVELKSVFFVLILISCLGFGIIYIIAPKLSAIIFGKSYYIAGEYIRCLCIMHGTRFIATSFAGLYTIFNKQKYDLIINIILIVLAAFSFIVCKILGADILIYLKIIGAGYSIVYISMLYGYIKLCIDYDKNLNNNILGDKNYE